MNIFITCAGGYIGGSVAMALLAGGHRVSGLARSSANAERLANSGNSPVLGTLDDADVLTRAARAADGAINCASADHVGAVRALIAGLTGSGKPLLHTSGSSVIGDDARGNRRSESIFDEDTPLVERQGNAGALNSVAPDHDPAVATPGFLRLARDSLIYGVGNGLNPNSVQIPFLVANAREKGVVQVVGQGLNVWSNVHIDDVADLYVRVLLNGPAGAFYFAENGEASFGDIGAAIAERLGLAGVEALPPEVAAERWGESKAYFTLGSNSRVRAKRARRELGWAPRHPSVIDWILGEMPVGT
jgi:nucleoside-diphosphate-sugar epimerase